MQNNPFSQQNDAYTEAFTSLYLDEEPFDSLDISMTDDKLDKLLINSLESDRDYWNQRPWNLQETDINNTAFLLGDQLNDRDFLKNDSKYVDNRLFSSVRAILSYATGQLAQPAITPSKGDEIYLKGAQDIGLALYQHASDNKVNQKVRAAVLNLISRKRGFLKLRYDPDAGVDGDIVTDICNPEDIIISRHAGYLSNPDKIYHRIGCTIDQLISRFPEKKEDILTAYGIQRAVNSQMSRFVHYYECWFTYKEDKNPPKEGVCWFIAEKHLILDKQPNPNWVYFNSTKKERQANVTLMPPKPFVSFNYINTGRSFIDETCLVEQARPMQEMLNRRGRQIWENADYVNGRWVADKGAFSQEDARNLINKGAKTVAMVDMKSVANPLQNVAAAPLPSYVEATLYDARNEIDQLMGTPSIFKGAQPDKKDTLGRDLLINQQAGALQDDLVKSISNSMVDYYELLLQMFRVYYTEDHWFQVKGGDGKYEFILLNGDKLDTDVKVNVQIDSTLPLDKTQIRSTAMSLWQAGNAIDIKSLYEDLGLPNPDVRAERYLKSQLNPVEYLQSIEISQIDSEAESDIMLLIANKVPEERDDYSQNYFDYFNKFISSNRFQKIQGEKSAANPTGNPEAAQRILMFLSAVQHAMMQTLNMRESLDAAAMIPSPPPQPPMPAPGQGAPIPGQPGAPTQPNMQPPTSQDIPPVPQAQPVV